MASELEFFHPGLGVKVRKSKRSNVQNCVFKGDDGKGTHFFVDGKDRTGPVLTFSEKAVADFIGMVKSL